MVNTPQSQKPKLPLSKEGFQRLVSGHPWIFKSQIAAEFHKMARGTGLYPLGEHWFLYSPQSEITLRRWGPSTRMWPSHLPIAKDRRPLLDNSDFSGAFLTWTRDHLVERYQAKQRLLPGEKCFRWIFSECDLMPGLVIDVFESDIVVQIQTAPIEHFWPTVKEAIHLALQDLSIKNPKIFEQRKSKSRLKEGLKVEVALPHSSEDDYRWITWNGIQWKMSPGFGQKTGAYFDQKENHWAAVHWAKTLGVHEAWDLCCFEGGFGLHLAQQGIKVLAVDDSMSALESAQENAVQNGISNFQTEKADVFEFLRSRFDHKTKTEMIVLDPPGVAGAQKNLASAMKGLKELNLRAFHCLKPGGVLVTCTCSHSVGPEELQRVVREAAHDARRTVRVLERRGPSPDHAPLIGFPESEYLQAWYIEVQ
jgi:23S rRNA (cytosine1962-C5)-methyltransferase